MIALVRHGAYSLQTGSLTDEGRAQAQRVAEELGQHPDWISIVSSPATRTRETARVIADHLKIPLAIDDHWGDPRSTRHCRDAMRPWTIYVTHQPILKALVLNWEPRLGEIRLLEA